MSDFSLMAGVAQRGRDTSHHVMYVSCIRLEADMRTTFNLDDDLLGEAGLRVLIERESARRLARLGATEPSLRVPPRRRPKGAKSR
jgi:hypothetical protein